MTVDKKKTCFVICPIGGNETDTRIKSDRVFNCIIKEALLGENYEIIRADMITESGKISTQIVNKLLNADLVIADLTGQNPNVFYELAVRHATKKPFIQIAEIDTELPFDVSDMRTIFYKLEEPEKLLYAIKELREFVKGLGINSKLAFNSPITESVLYEHIYQTGTDQEKILANIMQGINNLNSELSSRISYLERVIRDQHYSIKKIRPLPPTYNESLSSFNQPNDKMLDKIRILRKIERELEKLENMREVTKANMGGEPLPPELRDHLEKEYSQLISRREIIRRELNSERLNNESKREIDSDPSGNTKFDDF